MNIECGKCISKFEYPDNLNWKEVEGETISNKEKNMGVEKVHRCYGIKYKCPHCDAEINVIDVYEYPDGCFNYAIGRYEE